MTNFVGDDISLGELAGLVVRTGAKLVLQIVKKRGVEIHALVARTIERPHRRPSESAGSWFGPRKHTLGSMPRYQPTSVTMITTPMPRPPAPPGIPRDALPSRSSSILALRRKSSVRTAKPIYLRPTTRGQSYTLAKDRLSHFDRDQNRLSGF